MTYPIVRRFAERFADEWWVWLILIWIALSIFASYKVDQESKDCTGLEIYIALGNPEEIDASRWDGCPYPDPDRLK